MSNDNKGEIINKAGNVVCTEMRPITFKKEWEIEDCMENDSFESPIFSIGDEQKLKWCLKLTNVNNIIFCPYLILLPANIFVETTVKLEYFLLNPCTGKSSLPSQTYQKFVSATKITEYRCKNQDESFFTLQKICNAHIFLQPLKLICSINLTLKIFNVLNDPPAIELPVCDLAKAVGGFLKSAKLSDVTINVCGRVFNAHKILLAMQSRVFFAMFVNEMLEKQTNRVDVIDVEPEVFEEMLRFIYTGQAPNVNKIAKKLLVAAEMYDLERLKVICEKALCDEITIDNAADMLMLAEIHNAKHLKKRAVNFISGSNLSTFLDTEGFRTLTESHPILMAELLRAEAVNKI